MRVTPESEIVKSKGSPAAIPGPPACTNSGSRSASSPPTLVPKGQLPRSRPPASAQRARGCDSPCHPESARRVSVDQAAVPPSMPSPPSRGLTMAEARRRFKPILSSLESSQDDKPELEQRLCISLLKPMGADLARCDYLRHCTVGFLDRHSGSSCGWWRTRPPPPPRRDRMLGVPKEGSARPLPVPCAGTCPPGVSVSSSSAGGRARASLLPRDSGRSGRCFAADYPLF